MLLVALENHVAPALGMLRACKLRELVPASPTQIKSLVGLNLDKLGEEGQSEGRVRRKGKNKGSGEHKPQLCSLCGSTDTL